MRRLISLAAVDRVLGEAKTQNYLRGEGAWGYDYRANVINFLDLKPEQIRIEDIAWSLANLCRYTGRTRRFYSVAEHALLVLRIFDDLWRAKAGHRKAEAMPCCRMHALGHDDTEAYCNDLARGIKHLPQLAGYRELEAAIWERVRPAIGACEAFADLVKKADNLACYVEKHHLFGREAEPLVRRYKLPKPWWNPFWSARRAFLREHRKIQKQMKGS